MKAFNHGISVAAGLLGVMACGFQAADPNLEHLAQLSVKYSCGSETAPPARLILHPKEGIPNQYIAVFANKRGDVGSAAGALSAKFSGKTLYVYSQSFQWFAVGISDANAMRLSEDASICWVEQDALVTTN